MYIRWLRVSLGLMAWHPPMYIVFQGTFVVIIGHQTLCYAHYWFHVSLLPLVVLEGPYVIRLSIPRMEILNGFSFSRNIYQKLAKKNPSLSLLIVVWSPPNCDLT
jgi:hypothetical protein